MIEDALYPNGFNATRTLEEAAHAGHKSVTRFVLFVIQGQSPFVSLCRSLDQSLQGLRGHSWNTLESSWEQDPIQNPLLFSNLPGQPVADGQYIGT
jgi:hypothetical protein